MSNLSTQERIEIIKSIAADGGDIVGVDELAAILESGEPLFTYDGFEPSGQMHIAQGIIRAINTNKMIDAGFTFRMWVADWFGYLNNKMGGDLEKIKTVGKYFIEIWKASGMDLEHTEFLWTSDFTTKPEYWETVLKVAKSSTLKRVLRTTEIMGRSEKDDLSAAQIIYPCMQVTDIFNVMKCQVTQLGLDQKKVNILAREIGPELGFWKPVIVSQGMLQGLQKPADKLKVVVESSAMKVGKEITEGGVHIILETVGEDTSVQIKPLDSVDNRIVHLKKGEKVKFFNTEMTLQEDGSLLLDISTSERMISMKMSKSQPDTAIFMTDSEEDVKRKITKAYCIDGLVDENPILGYCKQIIFESKHLKGQENLLADGFIVERPEKWGGNIVFKTYQELEDSFAKKELSSIDLKGAVIVYLNKLLQPVRDHFENDANAKAILEQVKSFQVTR